MGKGEESNGTEANESTTFLTKSSSEASKMLEAALLQMDGIISGACAEGADGSSEWKDSVKDATRNLVTAIQNSPKPPPPPDVNTVEILLQWMQPRFEDKWVTLECSQINALQQLNQHSLFAALQRTNDT